MHRAQGHHFAPPQGLLKRRHTTQHQAFAQPVVGKVLVVGDDFQRQTCMDQRIQRAQSPGCNAVGVNGDGNPVFLFARAGS